MIDFSRIFRAFRVSKDKAKEPAAVNTLEGLVVETKEPVELVDIPDIPVKAEVSKAPLYGEALRRHLGWPDWFYDSLRLLEGKETSDGYQIKALKIKGDAQIAGAKANAPQQIQKIYTRLGLILKFDTPSFVNSVPWIFSYKNSHLDEYLKKLGTVIQLMESKFNYQLPPELEWKNNPHLYSTKAALDDLEARLKESADAKTEEDKLREALSVYAGKRVLVVGARTVNQREKLAKYLPQSTTLSFHSGESEKGLVGREISNFDVVVFTGGIGAHDIGQILQSGLGQDYNRRLINAYGQVNPLRVLSIMAENANRFK